MTRRTLLPAISPEAYRHPMDRQAIRALRAVPGFEKAASKFSRHGIERFLFTEMLASSVRVTPKQCGTVHRLLEDSCAVLDMPEPAFFLSQNPIVNAFALGREYPTIVLFTGLVELLTEDELRAVIAHELGHVQCGHTVYLLMALFVKFLLERASRATAGATDVFSISLQGALLEWQRKAEFSADRAALLVAQDPEVVFSALFKLTGGSPKVFEQMDREEYLKQAEEYDRLDTSRLDAFYKMIVENSKTHPIPVLRARETLRWGDSDGYRKILDGDYLRRDRAERAVLPEQRRTEERCGHCDRRAEAGYSFCTHCGTELTELTDGANEESLIAAGGAR